MKTLRLLLAVFLTTAPALNSFAAFETFPVRNRMTYVESESGQTSSAVRMAMTTFRAEILADGDFPKPEEVRNGRPFVSATPGETYSVRLYNPLPIRVAVNLTVDGLNSITGKASGIADGEKWIIDPYSSITIRGWQVNGEESRRFFFTQKPKSYAKWRGKQLDKDLAANCGVIGAAYFWSQQELDDYYASHPIYRYSRYTPPSYAVPLRGAPVPVPMAPESNGLSAKSMNAPIGNASAASLGDQAQEAAVPMSQKVGTGMGERESNPTVNVDFSYDTGMYNVASAVVIYYDFVHPTPIPNPFPENSFAPEMEN